MSKQPHVECPSHLSDVYICWRKKKKKTIGQVEELVEQAKDEMIVLEMYLKERLWEAVGDAEIDQNPTGMDDFAGVEEELEKS